MPRRDLWVGLLRRRGLRSVLVEPASEREWDLACKMLLRLGSEKALAREAEMMQRAANERTAFAARINEGKVFRA